MALVRNEKFRADWLVHSISAFHWRVGLPNRLMSMGSGWKTWFQDLGGYPHPSYQVRNTVCPNSYEAKAQ